VASKGTQFDPAVVAAFGEVLWKCAEKVVNRSNEGCAQRREDRAARMG